MTVGRIPSVEGGIQPTIFDAKADLLTATAADTPARLAVGANNTVLVADSTAATGLAWAGGWTSYTPTITGNSAFTLGNGVVSANYVKIGKTVVVNFNLTVGTTTVLPTVYTIVSVPFTAANVSPVGSSIYEDVGGFNYFGNVSFFGTGYFLPFVPTATAAADFVTATNPFTWGNGDVFKFTMTYEAA